MTVPYSLVFNVSEHLSGTCDSTTSFNVFTDTRKETKDGLFVPIVGERFDAHNFLPQAIEAGATASLWQKGYERPEGVSDDFPLFLVDDTLKTMQELAASYRDFIKPTVVAITGSNGKTSTKDILSRVLSESFCTYKTQGNFNNHIGMPLTILGMPKDTEVLILEMGMNHFGEISFLSRLAKPDYAIITNIGESHIEYLGSRQGIAKAKLEIRDGLSKNGALIIDGDEPLLTHVLDNEKSVPVQTCGYSEDNHHVIQHVNHEANGYRFQLNNETYYLPLLGDHHVKNASLVIATAQLLDMSQNDVQKGLTAVTLTGMRFQQLTGPNHSTIINDAYNASPTSMRAAINTIKHLPNHSRKILLLGDIYELGTNEETLHREVAQVINEPITDVIVLGHRAGWIADELSKHETSVTLHRTQTQQEAADIIKPLLTPRSVLLLKASRGVQLENVLELLGVEKGGL